MKQVIFLSVVFLPVLLKAQVTGRVVNSNNDGIPFASVLVKNTNIGTTADSTGYFSLGRSQNFLLRLLFHLQVLNPNKKLFAPTMRKIILFVFSRFLKLILL